MINTLRACVNSILYPPAEKAPNSEPPHIEVQRGTTGLDKVLPEPAALRLWESQFRPNPLLVVGGEHKEEPRPCLSFLSDSTSLCGHKPSDHSVLQPAEGPALLN